MNLLDIILLILFIPGIIQGLRKGFVEQGVTLVGIVLSVWMAFKFQAPVAARIAERWETSQTLINVGAFAAILVVVLVVVLLLAKLLTKVLENISLGWLNRVLGLCFSIATTAVVLAVLIILFDTINVKFELVKSPVLTDSLLYGPLKDFGYKVFPYLRQLISPAA